MMQYAPSRPQFEVFQVSGHLNGVNATDLQNQLKHKVASTPAQDILVDMAQVDSLDSSGLMVLVGALSFAQRLGRQLVLCSISPSVRIIFELTQLDKVFPIFDNQAAFEMTLP
ncbi:STAS domain-containing protein [Trichocoleus sp. FACHB-591]|uniref:STAS domain-containing protein n=1 Tax=Trichocoleus sp. FACHB-591 TaxID=2692872 RepID=UPI001F553DA2|nr:STAS domain-containing protein [Trichocoleus sp. FACHB-591]